MSSPELFFKSSSLIDREARPTRFHDARVSSESVQRSTIPANSPLTSAAANAFHTSQVSFDQSYVQVSGINPSSSADSIPATHQKMHEKDSIFASSADSSGTFDDFCEL